MPKKKKKSRKEKKKNNYFTEDTESAIVKFQKESSLKNQQKIFDKNIRPAFSKLVENIIFVYKFHTLDDISVLKNDCVSFLFESLYKFDSSKGHKAFSYFNVVAKNWFIQKVKTYKKKSRSDVQLDKTVLTKLEKSNHESVVKSYEDDLLKVEFLELLKGETKKWRGRFQKHQEKKVLEAIILLLENPDLISIYNKKGIYLYIREITGLNTKQVVTNLSKLKKKYKIFKKKYFEGDF